MATTDSPLFSVRIVAAPPAPEFELNINKGAWWPNSTRTDMTYSNAHLHTNGRCIEFCWAQHSRPPGDHTSVRWTDFTANGAPTLGYYWPENDRLIAETDNFPSIYMPWRQWICYWNQKVIDIGSGVPIARNLADGGPGGVRDKVFDVSFIGSQNANMLNSNYNPACLHNPDGNWTCWFGGGYFTNMIADGDATIKLVDDNPDYPARSTKPLRVRQISYGGAASPMRLRHSPKVGDWIYWGGAGVRDSQNRFREFYRIHIPTLRNDLRVLQERLPDAPVSAYSDYPLLVADERRSRVILVNHDGASYYQIPNDHGAKGTWHGPYGFADWRNVISAETPNAWWGCLGIHRSDFNQTFFRFNPSRKWNRIRWRS